MPSLALATGAGAGKGLEELLARMMEEEKNRQNQQRLNQTEADRRIAQDSLAESRRNTNEDRDYARTIGTVKLRHIGDPVLPEEYRRERAAGVPESLYNKQPAFSQDFVGPVQPEHQKDQTISFRGTPSDTLGNTREERLQDWGPPTVVIADPNVPGGTRVQPRNTLPPEGAQGPQAGAQKTQEISNDVGLSQLDNLDQMFNAGAKDTIGPAEGRMRAFGQQVPFVPVNKTFSEFEAATAAFRNSVIKAITGAQMSETEATRIRQQIPEITDKPDVWLAKSQQTRKNLQTLDQLLKGTRGSGGATPSAPPPTSPTGGGGSFEDFMQWLGSSSPPDKTPVPAQTPAAAVPATPMPAAAPALPVIPVRPVQAPRLISPGGADRQISPQRVEAPPSMQKSPIGTPLKVQVDAPAGTDAPFQQVVSDIKAREKFVPKAYQDRGGLAVGYGMHTWRGKPVTADLKVTEAEAHGELIKQLTETYAPMLDAKLKVPVSPPQYYALLSVMYNSPRAAGKLIDKLNGGATLTAQDFQSTVVLGGTMGQGISHRRAGEAEPFLENP